MYLESFWFYPLTLGWFNLISVLFSSFMLSHYRIQNVIMYLAIISRKDLNKRSQKNSCCCLVSNSCPTLLRPHGLSPPGSSVHGIFPARILEWLAISFSRRSFWPWDRTWVSCIGRRLHYHWATREACKNSW